MKAVKDNIRHPQDILIEQSINKICTRSHGENWDNPTEFTKKELSTFDRNLRKYNNIIPKHKITFADYNPEMTECIQTGVNPAFACPPMTFDRMTIHYFEPE